MSITVAGLLAQPELATRVLAGGAGLERAIGWAHVCELHDPWHWIGSGDLLMTTGIGIPDSPAAQVAYVERLDEVGAAGIALGENMEAPPLSSEMLAAADSCGLPLLLTRYEIPFIALARAVADASAREERTRIDQTVEVYELLRRTSVLELPRDALLRSLEDVARCSLDVVDPVTGRSVLHARRAVEEVQEAIRHWWAGTGDEAPALLHLATGDGVAVLMPGPRPTVLVARSDHGRLPDATVMRHLAAAAALQQSWLFAERERARRLGASLLAQLLDRRIDPALAPVQLEERGLAPGPMLLVACACEAADEDLHHLHHELDDAGVDHLMLARARTTYVLIDEDDDDLELLVARLRTGCAAGASDPVTDVAQLPAARREALWALHRAQQRKRPLVRHGDELGASLFLPPDRDDGRAVARRVVGPLLDHDARHSSDLVGTVRAFLEENRSWQRTAARLHVHKQTLVYRISKVEGLTGRSLSDTADVAELWLGLQAAVAAALLEDED